MGYSKIFFFFVYLGDKDSTDEEVQKRLPLIIKEFELLNSTLANKKVFDTKFLISVAPKRYHHLIRCLAEEYDFTLYKDDIGETNLFEYPAFLAMHEMSNEYPDSLFCYAHAKGSGNRDPHSFDIYKLNIEMLLVDNVESFFSNKEIQKVTLFPSEHGWAWHNFFWVRSDYINKKELIITDYRYYYESFIGEIGNPFGFKQCISPWPTDFNFNGFEVKEWYVPDDLSEMVYLFNR